MNLTDYTEKSTLPDAFGQQSRVVKYIKDILNNFFADSRNIKDQRLVSLMYDPKGNLNKDCVKVGCAFSPDKRYQGTTPAIIISLGEISYMARPVNRGGNPQFGRNPMASPNLQWRIKQIPVIVSVVTQSYDGTILLAQLIQTFLMMNSQSIQSDCNNISSIAVMQVSAVQPVPNGQMGNAKQVYMSEISVAASSVLSWTHDTQGPVFRGLGLTTINQ